MSCPFCKIDGDDGYFYNCLTTHVISELDEETIYIRSDECYEAEIARKDAWIRRTKSILSTVACSAGVIILPMFASKAQALLTEMEGEDAPEKG